MPLGWDPSRRRQRRTLSCLNYTPRTVQSPAVKGIVTMKGPSAFSGRKRTDEKSGLKFKDYFSLLLSAAAFVTSGITFYINVLSQTDELRAVVDQLPQIEADILENSLGVVVNTSKEMKVLLINSGNRPVAVREMGLRTLVVRPDTPNNGKCEGGVPWPGEGTIDVLKEKSSQIAKVKIKYGGAFDDPIGRGKDTYSFAVRGGDFTVRVCAYIAVATPSTGYASEEFEVLRASNQMEPRWDISSDKKAEPILIHRHTGTIFDK